MSNKHLVIKFSKESEIIIDDRKIGDDKLERHFVYCRSRS